MVHLSTVNVAFVASITSTEASITSITRHGSGRSDGSTWEAREVSTISIELFLITPMEDSTTLARNFLGDAFTGSMSNTCVKKRFHYYCTMESSTICMEAFHGKSVVHSKKCCTSIKVALKQAILASMYFCGSFFGRFDGSSGNFDQSV